MMNQKTKKDKTCPRCGERERVLEHIPEMARWERLRYAPYCAACLIAEGYQRVEQKITTIRWSDDYPRVLRNEDVVVWWWSKVTQPVVVEDDDEDPFAAFYQDTHANMQRSLADAHGYGEARERPGRKSYDSYFGRRAGLGPS